MLATTTEATFIRGSSDRKVRRYPSQQNCFGLPAGKPEDGGTCPHATTGPGGCLEIKAGKKLPVCYAVRLAKIYKGVNAVLQHNKEALVGQPYEVCKERMVGEFRRYLYTERGRGFTDRPKYRIHWSGDIPDETYARALADAMREVPEVDFWGYTRSMFSVKYMAGLPNVTWYISPDPFNQQEAMATYREFESAGNIAIAWMGKERPENFPLRLVSCPVDTGKMELEGGCHACKLCFKAKHIFFQT